MVSAVANGAECVGLCLQSATTAIGQRVRIASIYRHQEKRPLTGGRFLLYVNAMRRLIGQRMLSADQSVIGSQSILASLSEQLRDHWFPYNRSHARAGDAPDLLFRNVGRTQV
jgi:hypothetical protein